jgi:carboxylesterase
MLLVHGFPGTPAELRPLAASLHAAGWTTEVLLLPGFGAEIATLGQRRYTEWVTAVEGRLAALRRDYAPAVLVGFSMGAAISLNVAVRTPPDALALMNPFTRMAGSLWGLLPVIKRVIPQFKPFKLLKLDFNDAETRKGILQFMPGADLDDPAVQAAVLSLTLPTNALDQLRRVGQAGMQAAPKVACPVLVIQASADTTVNPAYTRELVARLPAGTAFMEVPGDHNFIRYAPESLAQASARIAGFGEDVSRTPNHPLPSARR